MGKKRLDERRTTAGKGADSGQLLEADWPLRSGKGPGRQKHLCPLGGCSWGGRDQGSEPLWTCATFLANGLSTLTAAW